MNERTQWIAARQPSGSRTALPWLNWCCDLGRLYCAVLERKPELTVADLIELCRVDSLGWLGVAPSASLFAACQAWIAKHGFHPELSAAMAAWSKKIPSAASTMSLKKDIGWLLWFDTTSPINEKACWSSVIRKDLRSMAPEQSAAWIALLSNVCSAIVELPTKKWLKPAEGLLKKIDPVDFRTRVRAWFEPFRSAAELRITLPARDILLALMWYSQLAQDPQVDEAVRWFGTAKWKSKADRDRTARLLPIWIHTMSERCPEHAIEAIHAYKATGQLELFGTSVKLYQDLCKRYGAAPQIEEPPPPAPVSRDALMDQAMARAMKGMSGLFGGAAPALGADTMEVAGPDGERYEIGLRDGRIVRLSDGKIVRLEIDWSRPPFGPFKPMIDGPDITNPFGKNYFRAILCAQVLSGAIHAPVEIIEDES